MDGIRHRLSEEEIGYLGLKCGVGTHCVLVVVLFV